MILGLFAEIVYTAGYMLLHHPAQGLLALEGLWKGFFGKN